MNYAVWTYHSVSSIHRFMEFGAMGWLSKYCFSALNLVLLSCFVTLELGPVNISPLQAGLVLGSLWREAEGTRSTGKDLSSLLWCAVSAAQMPADRCVGQLPSPSSPHGPGLVHSFPAASFLAIQQAAPPDRLAWIALASTAAALS